MRLDWLKQLSTLTVLTGLLIGAGVVDAQEVGTLFHITGCERGELVVPVVNMWDSAQMARIVGRLSGDGRPDQGLRCQGSVVKVLARGSRSGRTLLQIESVVNGQVGWITDSFVGRAFPRSKCREFFEDAEHISRCEG